MALSPAWIAASASAGAIAGDSIGFHHRAPGGRPLFDWLGRKFPRHFGPGHVALAERVFTRHGVWAVFFGRFIALLRIFAGPLAGSLRMPYGRFLAANASGGIIWATGITYLIWFLGLAAEKWLSRLSWLGLVAAVLVGLAITLLIRRKTRTLTSQPSASEAEARRPSGSAPAQAPRLGARRTAPRDAADAGRGATGSSRRRGHLRGRSGTGAQAANGRPRPSPTGAGRAESPEGAD